jgi:RNase P/RNase MRP subunit p29
MFTGELIGKEIEITQSNEKKNIGKKAKITNETKMTITINQNGVMKTLMKNTLKFKLSDGKIIEGNTIMKRPEDRIKGR